MMWHASDHYLFLFHHSDTSSFWFHLSPKMFSKTVQAPFRCFWQSNLAFLFLSVTGVCTLL